VGTICNMCNLTGHVMWKTESNYVVLKKVQGALLREMVGGNLQVRAVLEYSASTGVVQ